MIRRNILASRQKAGLIEVWFDGAPKNAPTYRAADINFGFGTWEGDTLTTNIGLKFGMYNWDVGNYTPGETRTLYFDRISQLIGTSDHAWEEVNPILSKPNPKSDVPPEAERMNEF